MLKCLTKQPEGRYASMEELVRDLEKLESGFLPDAVHEMMARSGGFNVPADYFRAGAMPVPVPASPALRRKRWPPFAVVGVVGGLLGLVGAGLAARSAARTLPSDHVQESLGIAVSPSSAGRPVPAGSTLQLTPAPESARVTREVLVSVVPATATITRDGRDLGGPPIALQLREGETAALVVSRKGYKTKTLTLDGNDPKQTIALEPVATVRAAPASSSKPRVNETSGGLEDVGDPFKKR